MTLSEFCLLIEGPAGDVAGAVAAVADGTAGADAPSGDLLSRSVAGRSWLWFTEPGGECDGPMMVTSGRCPVESSSGSIPRPVPKS